MTNKRPRQYGLDGVSRTTKYRRKRAKFMKYLQGHEHSHLRSSSSDVVPGDFSLSQKSTGECGLEVEHLHSTSFPSDAVPEDFSLSQKSTCECGSEVVHKHLASSESEDEVPPNESTDCSETEEISIPLCGSVNYAHSPSALSISVETISEMDVDPPASSNQATEHLDFLDSDDDCEDLQMNFLEEHPEAEEGEHSDANESEGEEVVHNEVRNVLPRNLPDYDPDDNPDDPDDDVENGDSSSEEEDEDETFCFDDNAMNAAVNIGRQCSRRDVLLLNLALADKHNWTYESLVDTLSSVNTAFGRPGTTPSTKKQLWSFIKKKNAGICQYAYCPNCLESLGKLKNLQEPINPCAFCGVQTPLKKLPWFVSVSLKKQLQHFLATPGITEKLRFRTTRIKHNQHAMEDIYDGDHYEELLRNGTIGPNDFTYVFNTDGFSLFKHRTLSVWALLLRLNELPPNMRQKHLFLGGLWIGKKEPKMNTFLKPFVAQANKLSNEGILWHQDGVHEIQSKIFPLCCCVDAKARCIVMNQHQYNGEYGCFLCTHRGVQLAGSNKYPLLPYEDLPEHQERTHASIVNAMLRNEFFEGQKGPSEVMLMNHFDMAKGQAMDDLHPFYEGVASFYTELLIDNCVQNEDAAFVIIYRRMRQVRSPIQMARKWDSITKRKNWKGSVWGYFIRYFAVICFIGQLNNNVHFEHLSMLSYALFAISRDSISPDELERASDYISRFLRYFQQHFGAQNMRFNVHMLQHAIRCRRLHGPAWTVSTFNFESWNHRLGKSVTSSKGATDQIVSRHLMKLAVNTAAHRADVSEHVRSQLNNLLFSYSRKLSEEVGDGIHVLGRIVRRQATEEERQLLTNYGINFVRICEYERVLVGGVEFRNRHYHPDTRSDNSAALTWNDDVVIINKIVVARDNENNRTCGMFVHKQEVEFPLRFAHHISRLTGNEDYCFIPADCLRVPAIIMRAQDESYVVPMANCREID